MSEPKDEPKGLDRRAVVRAALAIGGASLLGGTAAMPQNAGNRGEDHSPLIEACSSRPTIDPIN